MTAHEIRTKFLTFFQGRGHTIVASDSLVPKEDPTVLFTTAGMQQFKCQFLGHIGEYRRAASSQKCLRTDDLEEVGRTNYHHTFFEMLGNFSFGDYFKKDAIAWAWEFLTRELEIDPEKLWVSVYRDDKEAEDIWLKQIKIPKNRLVRLGDKSNFWPAEAKTKGPNGPCGPCSEIFYDYGVNPDCPRGDKCDPDCDCGRFSEIWNLVFTQFNRREDATLEPLPSKNIDTGMGLERLTAVMQGKKNNFETDLFVPILDAIDKETQANGYSLDITDKRIVADHIRAIVFGINDGVMPSNKGRGNVIKRLIIDSVDLMIPLGKTKTRLYKLVPTVIKIMQDAYPEIEGKSDIIAGTIKKVQEAFLDTRNKRIPIFKSQVHQVEPLPQDQKAVELGKMFFIARDTYGLTLSTIVSTTAGTIAFTGELEKQTLAEYENLMQQQQERSRAASKMAGDVFADAELDLGGVAKTLFLGYAQTRAQAKILKLFSGQKEVAQADKGQTVKIILDQTPFYAESGGQVGDTGTLTGGQGGMEIQDTVKVGDIFVHVGTVTEGILKPGQMVDAVVDNERRLSIMRNHTSTHLLQAGLRQVLGDHVQQQGSVVDEERLRFDFTHPQGVTEKEIRQIERFVYEAILADKTVTKEELSLAEARQKGALAFFEEKYGDTVRVVTIEGTSKEFCGGTHLDRTGQIGFLKIISESAIAQGIRRIEAKTGWGAFDLMTQNEDKLRNAARTLKAPVDEVERRAASQLKKIKQLEKELAQYRFESVKSRLDSLISSAPDHQGIKCISHRFDDIEIGLLRKICDHIKQKSPSAVIMLGSRGEENSYILIAATDTALAKGIRADELVGSVAPLINGSGGGRPALAQAGTRQGGGNIDEALAQAQKIIAHKLSS